MEIFSAAQGARRLHFLGVLKVFLTRVSAARMASLICRLKKCNDKYGRHFEREIFRGKFEL